MKNNSFIQFVFLIILSCLFLGSCSKNTPNSNLIEPVKSINWNAAADSMQVATYKAYLGTLGTYVINDSGNDGFQYWPNAHVLDVLVDAYERTNDVSYLPKMKSLIQGIRVKNGGTFENVFNDDMLWLGNSCVRAFEATKDLEYKDTAVFLWNEIIKSHSDLFGGGITWKKDTPKSKNAVSNGPAIILAIRLYHLDKDETYLNWAKSLYTWQKANLVDPESGLVWDNIQEINGQVQTNKDWIFTYNVGTWIGAGSRLYKITNEQKYLDDVIKTAKSTMVNSKLVTDGILRNEGQADGGLFKGILIRYFTELILLSELNNSDQKAFVEFLKFNAITFYKNGLSRPFFRAGPNWSSNPIGSVDLTTQLSGLMLIEAAAKLDEAKLFN